MTRFNYLDLTGNPVLKSSYIDVGCGHCDTTVVREILYISQNHDPMTERKWGICLRISGIFK